MKIGICIATYRRPERLGLLLEDLAGQLESPAEVNIVDNDPAQSARIVAERFGSSAPFLVRYDVQPERGIALTRNRTVSLASRDCDWLASVDDDERLPPEWLEQLMIAVKQYSADAVLAPVVPVVPEDAPYWIRRGNFYDFPRMQSGESVPLNRLRFGNVIVRGELMRNEPGPFNAAYGLMTGEDADLLIRLIKKGAHVVWCDEAVVHEPVESARLSLRWLLQRAFSGGQEFARKTLSGSYGNTGYRTKFILLGRSGAQLLVAILLSALALPFGRHRSVHWLIRAAANFGKLSTFWGWQYHEYAQPTSP